ncbi:hypothetical protein VPH35_123618 [Triticum aestivum]
MPSPAPPPAAPDPAGLIFSPTVARNARRSANATKPPSVVLGFMLPPGEEKPRAYSLSSRSTLVLRAPRLQPLVSQHARPQIPCTVLLLRRSSSVDLSSSSASSRRCLASSASPECVARNAMASSLCFLECAQPPSSSLLIPVDRIACRSRPGRRLAKLRRRR